MLCPLGFIPCLVCFQVLRVKDKCGDARRNKNSSLFVNLRYIPNILFPFFPVSRKIGQQPRLITIKSYTEICIEAGE